MSKLWRCGAAMGWLVLCSTAEAQGRPDIIVGRATTDSGKVVAGAAVTVTRAPDRAIFQAQSDEAGAFRIRMPEGTGDYLVYVTAVGRKPFRKRVTRGVGVTDSVLIVDAVLQAAVVQQLATVNVRAAKPKPSRNADPGTRTGAAEAIVDDFVGGVPPELNGNIAAMSAMIPGVTPVGDGIAVLGLGPSQNQVTLNGMAFGGSAVPRAAPTRVRLSTSVYDPAQGWFGGASSNVELGGGGVFTLRSATATADAPAFQASDALSRTAGQRFVNVDASVGGSGPLDHHDLHFYSYGVQGGRRSSSASSILASGEDVGEAGGVVADSARRLGMILPRLGLEGVDDGARANSTTDRVSFLTRFDRRQVDAATLQPPRRAAHVTLFGSWQQTSALAPDPWALPSRGARQSQASGAAQASWSTYFGPDYLATVTSALSVGQTRVEPFAMLPSGSVVIASAFPSGATGVQSVAFGGRGELLEARRSTWETRAETQLYASGREMHRITITADARLDGFRESGSEAALGNYAYSSLDALARNQPSSFTRLLGSARRDGAEWNGFVSVGDLWRVSPALRVEYGARVEGSAFVDAPAYNPLAEQHLGVRTDLAPRHAHVSPRLGFTWARRGAGNAGALAVNKFGAFNLGPTSYLRGGIGEFRTLLSPELYSDAFAFTGLPGALRQVTCAGLATPVPEWGRYATDPDAIPRSCVGQAGVTAFADTAPTVRVMDPKFSPPRSWRANLSFASQYRQLTFSVDGTYSLNLDQPSRNELNIREMPVFSTADEKRPVFVPPSAITANGDVSLAESRLTPAFGSVRRQSSAGRSVSRQLILTVAPDLSGVTNWWVSTSYVLGSTTVRRNGYDGTTFGSPGAVAWERSPLDARHQFLLKGGYTAAGISLTAFARTSSGLPYTPVVGRDVNGDGFVNDRAFIFAPASDVVLATETNRLLATTSSAARACLLNQAGEVAGANSCEGRWSTTLNAQVTIEGERLRLGSRVSAVRLSLVNPLAGIDRVLHGNQGLHGWGGSVQPDPVLYYVNGFDPNARRYRYQVNPRFGDANIASTSAQVPFRVSLDVALYLTPDVAQQQLRRYLGPGRERPGQRLTVSDLVRRYSRNVSDPYQAIMREADSLLLSRGQVDALQEADARYKTRVDSIWLSVATEFVSLPDRYDVAAAVRRQEEAIAEARELTRVSLRATLGEILTPIQLRLIPKDILAMYNAESTYLPGGRTLSP